MNQIKVTGNYLIITTDIGEANQVVKEMSQKNTVYSHNEDREEITIKDLGRNRQVIKEGELEDWEDSEGAAFNLATMLDFLRSNTSNFSTASGGSGVSPFLEHVLELSSDDLKAQVFGATLVPEPPIGSIPVQVVSNFYFIAKTTPYAVAGANFHINSATGIQINVPDAMFTFGNDAVYTVSYDSNVADSPQNLGAGNSKSIGLSNFTALTLGDGTLKVVTTYRLQNLY